MLPIVCVASDVQEQDMPRRTKIKKIYLEPEKSFFEKGKVNSIVSLTQGFDNNAHLDPSRKGDSFSQVFYKTTFTSPLNEKVLSIFDFTAMSLVYYDESDLDLGVVGVHAGLENSLTKDVTFSTGYYIDMLNYMHTGEDDYFENRGEMKIKQNLPHKMFHSLLYVLAFKSYMQQHTRTSAILTSDKKRDDLRNTTEYEIGKYFTKDMLKMIIQYYSNSSSEKYLDYYDYDSFKVGASLTHLFTDKIFGYCSLSRQYRGFRKRTLSQDSNALEHDRTYLGSAALFYALNKSLSFGVNYTYRQNESNEPSSNYSGSLISLGTYYKF
jgi:hypothetical protein